MHRHSLGFHRWARRAWRRLRGESFRRFERDSIVRCWTRSRVDRRRGSGGWKCRRGRHWKRGIDSIFVFSRLIEYSRENIRVKHLAEKAHFWRIEGIVGWKDLQGCQVVA
jgi:hypothetical protein